MLDWKPKTPSKQEIKARLEKLGGRLQGLKKEKTLRQKAEQAQGKFKVNFFDKNLADARRILTSTNQAGKIRLMTQMSVVCFVVGFGAAVLMRNVLMIPVLSVGFALIPMWYIRYSEVSFKKRLSNELEVALSVVTSSYIRTDNLLRSVEENLSYLNEPVRSSFSRFVNEVKYVDANVQNGIRNLRGTIDNPTFHDWCDILLLCVVDRTYKQSLSPVVEQFSDNKALQDSLETTLQMPVREFNMIAILVVVTIGLLYLINKVWFYTMVGTWGGKALLTVLGVMLFAGMNKAVSLTAPIE